MGNIPVNVFVFVINSGRMSKDGVESQHLTFIFSHEKDSDSKVRDYILRDHCVSHRIAKKD